MCSCIWSRNCFWLAKEYHSDEILQVLITQEHYRNIVALLDNGIKHRGVVLCWSVETHINSQRGVRCTLIVSNGSKISHSIFNLLQWVYEFFQYDKVMQIHLLICFLNIFLQIYRVEFALDSEIIHIWFSSVCFSVVGD